ncbi:hypothetical protein [Roseibacillus persicicus]|uniref:Uncharacterized protein n=1 Tax=Roseibacillus persicicus TaxID=454148 RepID=A0A918WKV8_9BACT|nr:hypothetical protein [Roseibacillus persicicus]GHC55679.1 hypothetical protein GCM10007100_22990 [Roseibacillus persicicus]
MEIWKGGDYFKGQVSKCESREAEAPRDREFINWPDGLLVVWG